MRLSQIIIISDHCCKKHLTMHTLFGTLNTIGLLSKQFVKHPIFTVYKQIMMMMMMMLLTEKGSTNR